MLCVFLVFLIFLWLEFSFCDDFCQCGNSSIRGFPLYSLDPQFAFRINLSESIFYVVRMDSSFLCEMKAWFEEPGTPAKKRASQGGQQTPVKRVKKEEQPVWKWWEEEPLPEGQRWRTLEHKGVVFAAPYVPLPKDVNFYYDGKPVRLSEAAEEVATFYAKMLEHDYTSKEVFNRNFFHDWRGVSFRVVLMFLMYVLLMLFLIMHF